MLEIELRSSCLDGTHFTDWVISLTLHKNGAVREACQYHWASILFTIVQLVLSKSLPNDSGHGCMSDGKHLKFHYAEDIEGQDYCAVVPASRSSPDGRFL